jgi:hypothetical protein
MSGLSERLQDASQSGTYRASREEELLAAARDAGLEVARIMLAGANDKAELLSHIAAALDFPTWFGGNWDALEDCITDLSWRAARAHLLLFEGFERLRAARGDDFGVLLDILGSSAEFWAERGRPFFAVFVDPGRQLALPELLAGKAP